MALLNLAYGAGVPTAMLVELERVGRRLGLPLEALEDLGRSQARCAAFLAAARQGDRVAWAYVRNLPPAGSLTSSDRPALVSA